MVAAPLEIGPAGLLRRLGAMVYDALVVIALVMVTLFLLTGLNRFEAVHGPWVNAILFLEIFAFFAFFWIRRGQTLGMLAWRLRVQNPGGVPINLTQATLRFIGALLALLTLGLGYLWMYVDPGRRTWPDLLSASEVVVLAKRAG
ncbi:MAG: RDD family protein [Gammaproteobacteria bacterium]|nr:RDD family protein [Gammaproteobacteria bacterium]|tara:strand:- start:1740 stop:2174 length:435 start_codon:yes stop_codon:yes gene_type:complete